MIKWRGFTLIELTVAITVLAILVTFASVSINRFFNEGRDARRETNVSTIVEALERYFDRSGEYPSCSNITAAGSTVSLNTLKGIDQSVLVTPGAPTGTTNSIRCATPVTIDGEDIIEYVDDGTASCLGTGSCSSYILRYRSDVDGVIKEQVNRSRN